MLYFTLGYIVVWLLLLAYTALIRKEQASLAKQVALLEEIAKAQREI